MENKGSFRRDPCLAFGSLRLCYYCLLESVVHNPEREHMGPYHVILKHNMYGQLICIQLLVLIFFSPILPCNFNSQVIFHFSYFVYWKYFIFNWSLKSHVGILQQYNHYIGKTGWFSSAVSSFAKCLLLHSMIV